MRYGYSLLLREFVEAEEVEFGDCETFQITCPVCKEAVFKKSRARPDGEATHFLSHYRADSPEEKDCELRVVGLAREHLAPFSAEGRNQTLTGFMAVLREAILDGQAMIFPRDEYRQAIQRVLSRPVFADFVGYARDGLTVITQSPSPRAMIADTLGSFPRFEDRSPFWQRRQAAYLLDVIAHLMTPKARENMRFLAAAAYVHMGLRAADYRHREESLRMADIGYDPLPAVDIVEALVRGKSEAALKKLATRGSGAASARTPAEAARCMARLKVALTGEVIGPMIGILAAIPYPDLARQRERARDDVLVMLDAAARIIADLAPGR